MRFMIRCDIEGVTGVTHPSQAAPSEVDYAYGVAMLHHDLTAVVEGLLSTGDHDLWVYDMHYYGRNLDMARLDPRVRVICGKPHYQPGNVGGLTRDFDGQILLGLHSMAGTGELLSHSYEHEVQEISLNGVRVGEIGLEAALAGELGVPTILVSGDSAGCAEARALLGEVQTVAVKESIGLHAGVCYATQETGLRLREAAKAAVSDVAGLRPYTVSSPVTLEIRLAAGTFADRVYARLAASVTRAGTLCLTGASVAEAWLQYLVAKTVK
jgi:D-amino peptidase